MGILSDSISLLSKSISKFSSPLSTNLKSKFESVATGTKAHQHLPMVLKKFLFSDLKTHNNKIQKLLVIREHNCGSTYYSRLSVELNRNNNNDINFIFPTVAGNYFHPFASCNALLLSHMDFDDDTHDGLWNPTTNEIKTLPKSSVPRPPRAELTEVVAYGLGFDHVEQDYKVIRFLLFGYEYGCLDYSSYRVEMYSLERDSWKEITYPYPRTLPRQHYSIHVNGFYYWLADAETPFIFSFDFANEEFSTVRIPLPVTDKLQVVEPLNILLAEFDGSLAALVYTVQHPLVYERRPFEIEIWVWNGESLEWTRVSVIVIDDVVLIEKALGLFNNDQLYLLGIKDQLLVFDCGTRELKDLGLKVDRYAVSILPYVGSREPIRAGHTMK